MDPVARQVLNYFPLPNQPGNAVTGAQNYFATGTAQLNVDNIDARVDHQLLREDAVVHSLLVPEDVQLAGDVLPRRHRHRRRPRQRAEPRAQRGHRLQPDDVEHDADERPARLRAHAVPLRQPGARASSRRASACRCRSTRTSTAMMFPRFGVSGMVTLGGNDHRYNAFMSYTAAASLTKVRGAHTLKGGFEGRMLRVNVWEARSAGTFNFRANETQGPNPNTASSTAGYGFASFLLGFGQPNDVLIQNWKNVAVEQLLLGLLRAGRLAGQLAADAQPRAALRHRRAAHGALQPDELLRSGCAVAAGAAGARLPRSARRRRVRRRRRPQPLPVQLGHQQHRAAPRRVVSAERQDGDARRLQPHVRPVEPGRAGHGRPVRLPHREPVGDDDRRHHAVQPAAEPVSERLPAVAGIVAGAAHAGGREPPGAAAGHAVAVDDSVQRQRAARAAVGALRRGRLRRHARLRPVDCRRRRLEPEPARSAVHGARLAAQSAGRQPLLRHRQQRRADVSRR